MATTEPPKENLDATPRLKSVSSLQQKTDPSRLHIVSLLCSTLYSTDEDDTTASALVQDLLDVCGGSEELLSKVLQTQFMDGRTPLHWIITNLKATTYTAPGDKPGSLPGLPPVLRRTLDQCSPVLSDEAKKDIERACCRRNADGLFQLLNRHPLLKDNATTLPLPGADPRVTIDQGIIRFTLPKFLDSMVALEFVHFKAIVNESLLYVQFFNNGGSWRCEVTRRGEGPNASGTLSVFLYFKKRLQSSAQVGRLEGISGKCTFRSIHVAGGTFQGVVIYNLHVQLAARNEYIGPDRSLSGELRVS